MRFSHETVKGFIESELGRKFKLSSSIRLAKTCLFYLASNAFDTPCSDSATLELRVTKYKFGYYGAQYWADHTRGDAENEPDIQRAVLSLLASENKKDSMLQMETYANSSWGDISFTKGQTLLHVIAKNGLATICRFILDERNKGELQTLGLSETDTDVAAKDKYGQDGVTLGGRERAQGRGRAAVGQDGWR